MLIFLVAVAALVSGTNCIDRPDGQCAEMDTAEAVVGLQARGETLLLSAGDSLINDDFAFAAYSAQGPYRPEHHDLTPEYATLNLGGSSAVSSCSVTVRTLADRGSGVSAPGSGGVGKKSRCHIGVVLTSAGHLVIWDMQSADVLHVSNMVGVTEVRSASVGGNFAYLILAYADGHAAAIRLRAKRSKIIISPEDADVVKYKTKIRIETTVKGLMAAFEEPLFDPLDRVGQREGEGGQRDSARFDEPAVVKIEQVEIFAKKKFLVFVLGYSNGVLRTFSAKSRVTDGYYQHQGQISSSNSTFTAFALSAKSQMLAYATESGVGLTRIRNRQKPFYWCDFTHLTSGITSLGFDARMPFLLVAGTLDGKLLTFNTNVRKSLACQANVVLPVEPGSPLTVSTAFRDYVLLASPSFFYLYNSTGHFATPWRTLKRRMASESAKAVMSLSGVESSFKEQLVLLSSKDSKHATVLSCHLPLPSASKGGFPMRAPIFLVGLLVMGMYKFCFGRKSKKLDSDVLDDFERLRSRMVMDGDGQLKMPQGLAGTGLERLAHLGEQARRKGRRTSFAKRRDWRGGASPFAQGPTLSSRLGRR